MKRLKDQKIKFQTLLLDTDWGSNTKQPQQQPAASGHTVRRGICEDPSKQHGGGRAEELEEVSRYFRWLQVTVSLIFRWMFIFRKFSSFKQSFKFKVLSRLRKAICGMTLNFAKSINKSLPMENFKIKKRYENVNNVK